MKHSTAVLKLWQKLFNANEIPTNGSVVSKDKKTKLDYNKIGNNFEFVVYEGEPNAVEGYTKVSYKKRDKNKVLMNYNQFVNYLYAKGFINNVLN